MQLRLTYSGLLMGSGNKPRPAHVHDIRRAFHPQLRHFWSVNSWLKWSADRKNNEGKSTIDQLGDGFGKGNYRFVPLVRRAEDVLCAIDILFLRAGAEGGVLRQGDIDNRLSTLFDALAVPAHVEQLAKHPTPSSDEDPFFCLLEDDSLVTQVSVDTGELLEATSEGLASNAARVVVTVRLQPRVNLGYAKLA